MSKQLTPRDIALKIVARKAEKRAYNKRKTFGNNVSEMFVTATRRGVRFTVTTHIDRFVNEIPRPIQPGTGFCDLDDEQIDRLVRRLQAIRGGRRRTHTSGGHRRAA